MRAKEFLYEGVSIAHSDPNAKQYFTNAVKVIADELNLPSDNITVKFDQKLPDLGQNGVTIPHGDNIVILITGGLSRAEQLYALSHEMVHAHQLTRGDLKVDLSNGLKVYWKGEEVPPKYNRSSEWENEAHAKEKDLTRKVISSIGNMKQ